MLSHKNYVISNRPSPRRFGRKPAFYLIVWMAAVLFLPRPAAARMTALSDTQMAGITGSGFSSFTLQDGLAQANLAIQASIYADIQAIRMGYYQNAAGNTGWDQNWTGVTLGTASQDMVMSGMFIKAQFNNISDPANRQLVSASMGFSNVTGTLTATQFASFSGIVSGASGVLINGQRLDLANVAGFQLSNGQLSLTLSTQGATPGYTVQITGATVIAK